MIKKKNSRISIIFLFNLTNILNDIFLLFKSNTYSFVTISSWKSMLIFYNGVKGLKEVI